MNNFTDEVCSAGAFANIKVSKSNCGRQLNSNFHIRPLAQPKFEFWDLVLRNIGSQQDSKLKKRPLSRPKFEFWIGVLNNYVQKEKLKIGLGRGIFSWRFGRIYNFEIRISQRGHFQRTTRRNIQMSNIKKYIYVHTYIYIYIFYIQNNNYTFKYQIGTIILYVYEYVFTELPKEVRIENGAFGQA